MREPGIFFHTADGQCRFLSPSEAVKEGLCPCRYCVTGWTNVSVDPQDQNLSITSSCAGKCEVLKQYLGISVKKDTAK